MTRTLSARRLHHIRKPSKFPASAAANSSSNSYSSSSDDESSIAPTSPEESRVNFDSRSSGSENSPAPASTHSRAETVAVTPSATAHDDDDDDDEDDDGDDDEKQVLQCRWAGCSQKCSSDEELYKHLCEEHVGRAKNGNLNLRRCWWGICKYDRAEKRDHMTSHMKTHVAYLRTETCKGCQKTFRRTQDLRKHEMCCKQYQANFGKKAKANKGFKVTKKVKASKNASPSDE